MTTLDDLWRELFGEPISAFERRIMTGVSDYVEERSAVLVLAAILVYILTKVLLRDAGSPFVIARKLGDTMRDLEQGLRENEQGAYLFKLARNELFEDIELTKNVLAMARKDAREREEFPPRAYRKIATNSFVGSLIGLLVAALILGSVLLLFD
jgi:hypothetical protein